jgi:flavin-dependent dehydrogenase
MKIGVIGARVGGSYASVLLSRMGHEVLLFDDNAGREKPCGGGITFKALGRMAWFHDHPLPRTEVKTIRFTAPDGYTSSLPLRRPIHVFSRLHLDSFLQQWAVESGARFFPVRARRFVPENGGWAIQTSDGAFEVDFLIGADGANSSVRAALIGNFTSDDVGLAIGFILPGLHDPSTLRIEFQEGGFPGYLWAFPCVDHSLVGIARWLPGARAPDLRRRVEEFIAIHYPGVDSGKRFYAARILCLSRKSLISQRVCGKQWALLGDAAGFTDSVTGEGIYYALRSAELLAASFRRENPLTYEMEWRSDFGANLESAAVWRDRFYGSMVLSQTFIRRTLQSVRHSRTVQGLLDDLLSGDISYKTLFRRLALQSPQILTQVICDKTRKMTSDE